MAYPKENYTAQRDSNETISEQNGSFSNQLNSVSNNFNKKTKKKAPKKSPVALQSLYVVCAFFQPVVAILLQNLTFSLLFSASNVSWTVKTPNIVSYAGKRNTQHNALC